MLKQFTINSQADIEAFVSYVYNDLDVIFHPDDDFKFSDYWTPAFTEEECAHLDAMVDACFVYCTNEGLDYYEICLPIQLMSMVKKGLISEEDMKEMLSGHNHESTEEAFDHNRIGIKVSEL